MAKSNATTLANGNDSIESATSRGKSHRSEALRKDKRFAEKSATRSDSSDSEEDDSDDGRSEESISNDSSTSTTDSADADSSSGSDSGADSDVDSNPSHQVKYNGSRQNSKPINLTNGVGHVNGTHVQSGSDSDSESDSSQSDHSVPDDDETIKKPTNIKGVSASYQKSHSSASESSDSGSDDNAKPIGSNSKGINNSAHRNISKSSDVDLDNSSEGDSSSKSGVSSQSGSESSDGASKSKKEINTTNKRKSEVSESYFPKRAKIDVGSPSKNLFVGNLSWNVDEEWLQREFSEFGEIAGCRVILDRTSGRSKGFGYVEFTNSDDAASALGAKKGALLDGREMNVDFSVPRIENANPPNRIDRAKERATKYGDTKSSPSDTLFVGNIPFSATAEELQESFGQHGSITRVSLPTDQASGAPKGFGYISFTSIEEAKAALEALNGFNINGRSIRLDFATPRPGGDGGFRGGRGDIRGGRGGDRGGRGIRGAFKNNRGDFQSRGTRGFSTNRGGVGDFSGKKMTF